MLKIFSNIFLLMLIIKFILEILEFKKIKWNLLLVRKVGKVIIFHKEENLIKQILIIINIAISKNNIQRKLL